MTLGDLMVRIGELTGNSRYYRVGPHHDLIATIRPTGEDFTLAIVGIEVDEETGEIVFLEAPE